MDYSLAGIPVWLVEHAEILPVLSDAHHSSQRGQSQCLLWLSALRHSYFALFHFLFQHEEVFSILSLTNAATRKIKSTLCKKTNVVGGRYFQNIRKLKLEKCLRQYQATWSINYLLLVHFNEKICLIFDHGISGHYWSPVSPTWALLKPSWWS